MEVQGTDAGMIGPGGESAFTTSSGEDWLVYHYYDAYANGDAWLQIRPLSWVTGWPVTGSPAQPSEPAITPRTTRGAERGWSGSVCA